MNERIRQLAEQALNEYSATYHNEAKIPEAYLKKFAELIVQDCIDNVKVWEKDSRNHISYMLKNHYGVEP
jgi:hypothetical protein